MMDFLYPADPYTHRIAGVDEVGRGPLIGNVVTAAVILDPSRPIEGLNDSKKLSEKKREILFRNGIITVPPLLKVMPVFLK